MNEAAIFVKINYLKKNRRLKLLSSFKNYEKIPRSNLRFLFQKIVKKFTTVAFINRLTILLHIP